MVAWRMKTDGEGRDQQRTTAPAHWEVGYTELGDERCEKEVPDMTPRSLT